MREVLDRAKRHVAPPVRRAQHRVLQRLLEPGFEDTQTTVPAKVLDGLGREDDHDYQPSGWTQPWRALRGATVTPQDVFVDLGSGKGRVVLLVARFWPFGRVVGAELSETLNEVARRNAEIARPRLRCKDVEIVHGDLMTWPLPDDATHVYHNNSVGGAVFDAMLGHIIDSLDRRPRPLRLMYANPLCHDAVVRSGRFTLVRTSKGPRPDLRGFWVNVYEART